MKNIYCQYQILLAITKIMGYYINMKRDIEYLLRLIMTLVGIAVITIPILLFIIAGLLLWILLL